MLCGISCESGVHQTQTPKPNLSQLYLSRLSLAKLTKLNFFKTPASGRTGTRVAGTESHFNADPDPAFPNNADPDPAFPLMRIRTLQGSILSLQVSTVSVNGKRPCISFWIYSLIGIRDRIQLFTLTRIQILIQLPKIMQIHADPDPLPYREHIEPWRKYYKASVLYESI